MKKIQLFCFIFLCLSFISNSQPIMVTNTTNTGAGSFREAIYEANYQPGYDTILFDIPGTGPHTIIVAGDLPFIDEPVFIDGYSQPGASPNTNAFGQPSNTQLMIEIHAAQTPAPNYFGLVLYGAGSKVQGLAINNFDDKQIDIYADNTEIVGNYIGIGIDGNSMSSIGIGVFVNQAHHCIIGGSESGARNIISGNFDNIFVSGGNYCSIMGNFIGVNPAGTEKINPQPNAGIVMNDSDHSNIGGVVGNVISGADEGIEIINIGINTYLNISGNYIGTDASGMEAIANSRGISISFVEHLVIGGPAISDRNIISGNWEAGIFAPTYGANLLMSVLNNYIGYAADGITPLGNTNYGIYLDAHNNMIGSADAPNLIGHNGVAGIVLTDGIDNKFYDNLYNGNGIAIDLNNDGPTPNDEYDLDNGPNNLINKPVFFVNEINDDGDLLIDYWIDCMAGTAIYPLTVMFFESSTTGSPQGGVLIGSDDYYSNDWAVGSASVNLGNANELGIEADDLIVGLAHDAAGNTSEFSEGNWVNSIDEFISQSLGATLNQNIPNPCKQKTMISYELIRDQNINLSVYTINGELITNLVNQKQSPGEYEVEFITSDLVPGPYYYRLSNGKGHLTQKMVVFK